MDTDYKISCKLTKEAKKALDAFKGNQQRQWPLREIRIHLLDEDGDGLGIWMEYDPESGELKRGMLPLHHSMFYSEEEEDAESDLESLDEALPVLLN